MSPPKVYAEMAIVVNWGEFIDAQQVCRTVPRPAFTVSAAGYGGASIAPESIVSTFGESLAEGAGQAGSLPLPLTLAGVSVEVTDANGVAHDAPLLFVSRGQANWIVPAATATGLAVVAVRDAAGVRVIGEVTVSSVAPALFSADSSGSGAAAAIAVRVASDGSQSAEEIFRCTAPGACEPTPVDAVEPGGQVVLVLFGTGIRHRQSLGDIRVTIGGIPADVYYAGPQPQFPGLDQLNVRLSAQLAGRGLVVIELGIAGRLANAVTVLLR
ncbi:MAG: hypothetical protein GY953_21285 [bacterium]|nr:hypothetical protein [bacterium]